MLSLRAREKKNPFFLSVKKNSLRALYLFLLCLGYLKFLGRPWINPCYFTSLSFGLRFLTLRTTSMIYIAPKASAMKFPRSLTHENVLYQFPLSKLLKFAPHSLYFCCCYLLARSKKNSKRWQPGLLTPQ